MAAIVFPLVLLCLAFVVDAAHAFVDQRHLQNTADAASLAAAQQIAKDGMTCPADCVAQVNSFASQNDFTPPTGGLAPCTSAPTPYPPPDQGFDQSTTCYQYPYNSDPQQILVKLHVCTTTFFGSLVGVVPQICSSVRSVSSAKFLTHVNTTVTHGMTTPDSTILSTTTITNITGGNSGALFASNTACSGGITITSNSQFHFNGSGAWSNGGFH